MDILGLDIGGANLKAAHTTGPAASVPFALWRQPDRLADELRKIVARLPEGQRVALTMTGELCDCFPSKRHGVTHILSAAAEVFGTERLDVWTTAGRFVDAKTAREEWHQTASANWLALATFAGRYAPSGTALLMDVGTTTTDLIPLSAGKPIPTGRTDAARLVSGELLYRGWRRTPLCAIYHEGAAEWFATMHDVCLVLHRTPDCPDDRDTADGQPATREAALRRLARMRCADVSELGEEAIVALGVEVERRVHAEIRRCVLAIVERLPERPRTLIVSGSGSWLTGPTLDEFAVPCVSLDAALGTKLSAAACAYAVAVLRCEAP